MVLLLYYVLFQGNDRETEKEMLLASNRSLAEYNLSMEQDLMSHKTEVKNCTERGEEWYHRVYKKYETLCKNFFFHVS